MGESDPLLQAAAVLARMTRIATRIGSVERIIGGTASLMPAAGTGPGPVFSVRLATPITMRCRC